jgi:integrase
LARLRFRLLVEVLLGTGARISEILALDRCDVDAGRREVKIIGRETSSGCSSLPTERWSGLNAISVAGETTNSPSSSREGTRHAA